MMQQELSVSFMECNYRDTGTRTVWGILIKKKNQTEQNPPYRESRVTAWLHQAPGSPISRQGQQNQTGKRVAQN